MVKKLERVLRVVSHTGPQSKTDSNRHSGTLLIIRQTRSQRTEHFTTIKVRVSDNTPNLLQCIHPTDRTKRLGIIYELFTIIGIDAGGILGVRKHYSTSGPPPLSVDSNVRTVDPLTSTKIDSSLHVFLLLRTPVLPQTKPCLTLTLLPYRCL